VTPQVFRAHCQFLAEHYEVLTLAGAYRALTDRRVRHRPLAAITFDDGYRDNATWAAPALAETGLRATFFVIAGLVNTNAAPWYDRMARAWTRLLLGGCDSWTESVVLKRHLKPDGMNLGMRTPGAVVAMAKQLGPAERSDVLAELERFAGPDEPRADDLIMGSQQLAALARAGHEIGAHGLSHAILTQLDDEDLASETAVARQELSKLAGM
jgi:peptidoglycan/xylan/chitin deacetylase (PgdA/CDA1 family)